MRKSLPSHVKPLALLIGAYVLVFFALAYRKYEVFGADSGDYAFFDNMFWWTMRGRPFFCSEIGVTNFGMHAAYLWPLVVPAYWFVPGVPTLLFVQSLLLGAAGIPVYLIARNVLQEHRLSLILTAAFLLLPPFVSQHVNQVEELPLIAVFILFAFYFYARKRFGLFLLFAGIACLGRENIPLAILMFGVYSLVLRRDVKWVVAPVVMGLTWFGLATFVLIPHFRQSHPWHVMKMFSYLGDTPRDIAVNALTHPLIVVRHVFGKENVNYLLLLFQPVGWILPFFSPASLMALPDLALNTITNNGAMKVIPWHYNVITSCFLFVGAIHAVKKAGGWLQKRSVANPEAILSFTLLALSISHWYLWFSPQHYSRLPQHEALVHAIAAVPSSKSVLVPIRILSRVGARESFNCISVFQSNPDYAAQFEYVILDANERQYAPVITQEFFDKFYRNPKYQLMFAEQNVFVFKRLGGESDWKIPPP